MKPNFAAQARELLYRLDSQQFAFTASDFEQRVADRKIALDIIAAALEAAWEEGQRGHYAWQAGEKIGRAEGRREGLEEARSLAAECLDVGKTCKHVTATFIEEHKAYDFGWCQAATIEREIRALAAKEGKP